jgi:hypothetical protein
MPMIASARLEGSTLGRKAAVGWTWPGESMRAGGVALPCKAKITARRLDTEGEQQQSGGAVLRQSGGFARFLEVTNRMPSWRCPLLLR